MRPRTETRRILSVRSVRLAHGELVAAQKPGNGVPAYLRWVNRPLGRGAAAVAAGLGLTPNIVSVVSLFCSVLGMAILMTGGMTVLTAVGASVLLLIGYAFDSADGQLARLTGASSAKGEWLDHVVDAFRLPAVHLSLAVALTRHSPSGVGWPALVAVGFALLASLWFFAQILAEKLQTTPIRRPGVGAPPWISFVKLYSDVGFLYLLLLLMPWPSVFIPAYTALAVLTAGIAGLSLVRKYRSL